MCYSAQVWADYRQYVRSYGAELSVKDFFNLFYRRSNGEKIAVPKTMEAASANPQSDKEREVIALSEKFAAEESMRFQKLLFEQVQRLNDAERQLQAKPTKAATESQRIATKKIDQAKRWLADLRRTELVGIST